MQRKRSSSRPETEREREARERREAELVKTRCGLCEEIHEGALKEGRQWHAVHLRDSHPDFEPAVAAASGSRRRR